MGDVKVLRLRRDDSCGCGADLPRGTRAGWDRAQRIVICEQCLDTASRSAPVAGRRRAAVAVDAGVPTEGRRRAVGPPPPPVEVGAPGRSLVVEFERRRAAEEAEILRRHRILGRWLARRTPPSPTTQSFAVGAEGELVLSQLLMAELQGDALWLFNRRLGLGSKRGDVDLVAVVRSGVWVIDSKHYRGRKIVSTGDAITVNGRRRGLTDSIERQIAAVTSVVPDVPTFSALCFVGAKVRSKARRGDGVAVTDPKQLLELLRSPGPLDAATRDEVHRRLAAALPPA